MAVLTPHGPVHEDVEFWYDPEEKVPPCTRSDITTGSWRSGGEIIYRCNRKRIPDTQRMRLIMNTTTPTASPLRTKNSRSLKESANIDNTELIIRLWCQDRGWRATHPNQTERATTAGPQTLGTVPFIQTGRDVQAGITYSSIAPATVPHHVEGQTEVSLTDLNLKPVYNHSNCPDMIAGLYEPHAPGGRPV